MPFDEDEEKPTIQSQKIGLKQVSSQKSVFDSMPKKPTLQDLEKRVHSIQQRNDGHKAKAAELASQFVKMLNDKTLKSNKNIFARDMEKEVLSKMIQLAIEINNDDSEQEGMGSLSWITLLFNSCLHQRDKINDLECNLSQISKKIDPAVLTVLIKQVLDSKKDSE